MRLLFEQGTEQYVKWAKSKLLQLTSVRKGLRVVKMTKAYAPESGVLVHIVSSDYGDSIRITGGFSNGRFRRTFDGAFFFPTREYLVKKDKVTQFGETPTPTNPRPVSEHFSVDGKTYIYRRTNGNVEVRRRLRSAAVITGDYDGNDVTGGTMTYVPLLTNISYVRILNANFEEQPMQEWTRPAKHRHWITRNGFSVVTLKQELPVFNPIAQIQLDEESLPEDQWGTTTLIDSQIATGVPPQITLTYDAILGRWYSTMPHPVPSGGGLTYILPTYPSPFGSPWSAIFTAGFDYFNNCPVVFAAGATAGVPEVSQTLTQPDILLTYLRYPISYKLVLAKWTGAWEQIWSREIPEALWEQFRMQYNPITGEVASPFGTVGSEPATPNMTGQPTPSKARIATAKGKEPWLVWVRDDKVVGPLTWSGSFHPFSVYEQGAITTTGAGQALMANDTVLFTLPSVSEGNYFPFAVAPQGYLLRGDMIDSTMDIEWIWSDDGITFQRETLASNATPINTIEASFHMSVKGTQVFDTFTANTKKFHSKGVLKRTWGLVVAANEANYTTYGVDSPDGFWFVDALYGWSYKNVRVMKARVYTKILKVGGEDEVTLQGGSIVVQGVGTVLLPQNPVTPTDGFTIGSPVLYWSGGATFTEADISALFGGVPVTFTPNGVTFQVAGPPPTYNWQVKTVDLVYDDTSDTFSITKEYSETLFEVPSRGPLEEDVLPGDTVQVSQAALIQDEFVPKA